MGDPGPGAVSVRPPGRRTSLAAAGPTHARRPARHRPERRARRAGAAILRQDAAPRRAATPEPAVVGEACPYKGLAHYDVGDDRELLRPRRRGRQLRRPAADDAAARRRRTVRVRQVVTGARRAVPALQRRGHGAVVFVPGDRPGGGARRRRHRRPTSTAGARDRPVRGAVRARRTRPRSSSRSSPDRRLRHSSEAPVVHRGPGRPPRRPRRGRRRLSRLAEQGLHLVSPLAGDALREAIEQPARERRPAPRARAGRSAGARQPRASRVRCRCSRTPSSRRGSVATGTC